MLEKRIREDKSGACGDVGPFGVGSGDCMRGEGDQEDRGVYGTGERVRGGDYFRAYDLETSFDKEFPYEQVDRACLERAVQQFIGEIEQFPPSYSAVRVDGVRAYEMARRGDEVEMKSRKVMVREIEILKAEFPIVELRIVCSKGTYIRSLAHDLGKVCGSGSHLSALRRTRVGDFRVEDLINI